MRQVGNPTPAQQAAFDYERAARQAEMDAYKALPVWKRAITHKPSFRAFQPGVWEYTRTFYIDGGETEDVNGNVYEGRQGSWVTWRRVDVRVNDYSPSWYRERAQEQRRFEAEERRRAHQQQAFNSELYRANAGANYYDSAQPWAWQRDVRY